MPWQSTEPLAGEVALMVRWLVVGLAAWFSVGLLVALLFGQIAKRVSSPMVVPGARAASPARNEAAAPVQTDELAIALHGLRSSISLVVGAGELLRDAPAIRLDPMAASVVDAISIHGSHVERLTTDLLSGLPAELLATLDRLTADRELEELEVPAAVFAGTSPGPSGAAGSRPPAEPSVPVGSDARQDDEAVVPNGGRPAPGAVVPLRPRRRSVVMAAAAAGSAGLLFGVTGAAASTGSLPDPAQRAVAEVAERVGIDLPRAPVPRPPVAPSTVAPTATAPGDRPVAPAAPAGSARRAAGPPAREATKPSGKVKGKGRDVRPTPARDAPGRDAGDPPARRSGKGRARADRPAGPAGAEPGAARAGDQRDRGAGRR